MIKGKTPLKPFVVLAICLVGIFGPDLTPPSYSRSLTSIDEQAPRALQEAEVHEESQTRSSETPEPETQAVEATKAPVEEDEDSVTPESQPQAVEATKAPVEENEDSETRGSQAEAVEATKSPVEENNEDSERSESQPQVVEVDTPEEEHKGSDTPESQAEVVDEDNEDPERSESQPQLVEADTPEEEHKGSDTPKSQTEVVKADEAPEEKHIDSDTPESQSQVVEADDPEEEQKGPDTSESQTEAVEATKAPVEENNEESERSESQPQVVEANAAPEEEQEGSDTPESSQTEDEEATRAPVEEKEGAETPESQAQSVEATKAPVAENPFIELMEALLATRAPVEEGNTLEATDSRTTQEARGEGEPKTEEEEEILEATEEFVEEYERIEEREAQRSETPAPAPVKETPFENGGVNGDPLIMGLSGQLFKFDGRSGAWYSAVSTPSFQWNLKVNNYETCPDHSDTFVSAAGFTFFDKRGRISKRIQVGVVNPYYVDVGCGSQHDQSCLGFGSLELIIDGVKHVVGGHYKTKDGTARITAFNTFYQCSRKWYDFDVRPQEDPKAKNKATTKLRNGRALATSETEVFDVISSLKSTMIDAKECQNWIEERRAYSDLFKQPGHYSTIIITTENITLHVEYKQENERCNAHSIDVWISSVSPVLLDEKWEGVIGETKDPDYIPTGEDHIMVDRSVALKYPVDEDYEVNSGFATRCKGCSTNQKRVPGDM